MIPVKGGGMTMKKPYSEPIALYQRLTVEDIVRTSGGLSVAVDTEEGYGTLKPLK